MLQQLGMIFGVIKQLRVFVGMLAVFDRQKIGKPGVRRNLQPLDRILFILVYSDQRSCAIRPAIPKVSGHRSRSIRPSFLSIRPTAGTSRLECTMN